MEVIPAQAGIHLMPLDPRFREGDNMEVIPAHAGIQNPQDVPR